MIVGEKDEQGETTRVFGIIASTTIVATIKPKKIETGLSTSVKIWGMIP